MKEKIILKSANPEEYGDLTIECRVIENDKIKEYVDSLPEERKFVAYKTGKVLAREGVSGEEVKTVLKTTIDGKTYILNEETGTVKTRKIDGENEVTDKVIKNISSTSNEEYVVRADKFEKTYVFSAVTEEGIEYIPAYDPRELTRVDENIIIVTAWGSKAICLKGSFIVTYNAEENDYNTLEEGAFKSTYSVQDTRKNVKTKKRV